MAMDVDDNDDPDNLAAAFFARQEAEEKAKNTLPTDDWIRVVEEAVARRKKGGSDGASDAPADAIVPSSWLATSVPPAPAERHGPSGTETMLDSSAACSLAREDDAIEGGQLTPAEEEARRRIKEHLVRRLEEKMEGAGTRK